MRPADDEDAERCLTPDAPAEALARAAGLLAAHPAEPGPYRSAAAALLALAERNDISGLQGRTALLEALLLQHACPVRPYLFHQAVADRITGHGEVAGLVRMIQPTLRAMSRPEPPLPVLLFLLVVRSHLGRWMPQRRLTTLHLKAFQRFEAADLMLPYSAMFHPRAFGRNRQDLAHALRRHGAAFTRDLAPHHMTLLAWSAGGKLPPPAGLAGTEEADRRSARSLLLAGCSGGEALSPEGSRLAEELAASRAALSTACTGGGRLAAWRVGTRAVQAAEVARSMVAASAPFVRRSDRRIKVAICVSGQLRGHARALPTWRANLFAQVEAHFFVHSWARIGRGPAQPWRAVLPFAGTVFPGVYRRLATQEGLPAFEARYPSLYRALEGGGRITADELRRSYGTPHAVVEDEDDPRFNGWSNSRKMHEKIAAAHALAANSGEEFDLFVRLRPDLSLRSQAFRWADLRAAARAAPRLWADGAFGVHHGVPMIGDQFAVGTPAVMARYAETAALYPRLAALELAGAPAALEGHVSLAQICWLHGIRVDKAPIRFGRLLEPEPFGTAAIIAALETDAAGRHDAIDRALIEAARADLAV
jgi:hypothetical protein